MNIVILDIGGVKVKTLKTTLTKNSYFSKLFENMTDSNDDIFIDCDYDNFKHILRKLQYPNYVIPTNSEYLMDYFEPNCGKLIYILTNLQSMINEYEKKTTVEKIDITKNVFKTIDDLTQRYTFIFSNFEFVKRSLNMINTISQTYKFLSNNTKKIYSIIY